MIAADYAANLVVPICRKKWISRHFCTIEVTPMPPRDPCASRDPPPMSAIHSSRSTMGPEVGGESENVCQKLGFFSISTLKSLLR